MVPSESEFQSASFTLEQLMGEYGILFAASSVTLTPAQATMFIDELAETVRHHRAANSVITGRLNGSDRVLTFKVTVGRPSYGPLQSIWLKRGNGNHKWLIDPERFGEPIAGTPDGLLALTSAELVTFFEAHDVSLTHAVDQMAQAAMFAVNDVIKEYQSRLDSLGALLGNVRMFRGRYTLLTHLMASGELQLTSDA